ncbi:hypothetical protein BH11PSE11_BH11PSE11_23580 [soil metagenome]
MWSRLALVALTWLTVCAAHAYTLDIVPACPSPSDSIYLEVTDGNISFQPISVQINGSNIKIAILKYSGGFATAALIHMRAQIGPLAEGAYHVDIVTRYDPAGAETPYATREFWVRAAPQPCTPVRVTLLSPALQVTPINTVFPQTVRVRADDALGRPAANAAVKFGTLYGPMDATATFSAETVLTGADGVATVTATANSARGTRSYFAFLGGSLIGNETAHFVMSNLTAPDTSIFAAVVEYVEYFKNNRFFLTADPAEMLLVDQGKRGSWVRTGRAFLAYPANSTAAGVQPVCRFYGSLTPGPNSHFFTADPGECEGLKQLQAATPTTQKRWNYEGTAFGIVLPQNGSCPQGTLPVWRAFNGGPFTGLDPNHFYTTSTVVYAGGLQTGWQGEGVTMCAAN